MFKNTNIKIAFRANSTIYQQLVQKTNSMNPSGVYEIKCNTCSKNYVGQSGRPIATRHKEHIRYIKTNKPVSAYAIHILNNRHEYGTANDTLKTNSTMQKKHENEPLGKYVHTNIPPTRPAYHEQQINELYELAQLQHTLRNSSQAEHQQTRTPNTHK